MVRSSVKKEKQNKKFYRQNLYTFLYKGTNIQFMLFNGSFKNICQCILYTRAHVMHEG